MPDATFAHERQPSMIVGFQGDDQSLEKILAELSRIGYKRVNDDWMVGGSQEISLHRLERGRDKLVLQAETYEDLKLFGAQRLLDEVRQLNQPTKL